MSDDLSQSPPKSSSKTSSVVSSDDNNNSERVSDISSLFTDTGSMVNANSASESANHESILVYDTSTSSSESEIFVLLDKNESSALIMSANHTRKKRSYSSTPPIKRPKRTNTVQSYVEIHKPSNNRSSRKRLLSTTLITKEIDDDDSCDGTTGKPSNASNDDSSEEPVYEVESVLDYTVDDNVEYYLVKWKGWSESDNTWEPSSNLEGCTSLIRKFHRLNPYLKVYGKKQLDDYDDSTSGRLDAFLRRNARVIGKLVQNLTGNLNCIKGRNLKSSINEIVRSLKNEDDEVRYSVKMPEGLKRLTMSKRKFLRFLEMKVFIKQKLEDWQNEINKVSSDPAPIVVINDVDFEYAPESFNYINDYKAGEGISIPDDPLVGCDCEDCYENRSNCCGHQSGSSFAYTKYKKLKVPAGSPIYECNKRCACGPGCLNRVVQHGRKVKLAIFRTSNLCGWGVKTLEAIPKGTFVMEYVGEVISEQEAERRGHKYDEEGRTYLFDLDYDDGDCPFTVDAAYQGNISHFMNHSCDPNLVVFGVWINSLDPRLPRLAFFSLRDIKRGEELSFDYMMSANRNNTSMSESTGGNNLPMSPKLSKTTNETTADGKDSETKRILCKCGSSNCRKYLF
ncbi:Histone-lysine N-methyltransferase SUV39H2 [Nymphon striatum]|nr:Histone-lysine N-methyltransferase SUV39H2 [Nymphon striatum]